MQGGAILSCEDGSSVVILNGKDGEDGKPGQSTPYTITGLLDPCGRQGVFDEVLLVLEGGQVLAHYSQGNKQFLTVLLPGSYITTDGTNCLFTLNADSTLSNERNR
jgi:hypothetical protein